MGIIVAGIFAFFGMTLSVPAIAAVVEGHWRALEAIALIGVSYAFLAAVLALALGPRRRRLNRTGVFTAASVAWLALVVAATPVFLLVDRAGLIAALFEATSASVTMGLTLRAPQDISVTMGVYRGTVAWVGGLLTLVTAVYVLGPYQVGGTPNSQLRLVQHARTETEPQIGRTFTAVLWPYLGLTVLCGLLLTILRVPPQDAVVVGMGMLATSGFVPHQTGGSVLNNTGAEAVMMVFMLIGATSIVWHRMLAERRWMNVREQSEGLLYISSVIALIVLAMLASLFVSHGTFTGFRKGFSFAFDVVSATTTTGITHDARIGSNLPLELALLVVFIGGCSYSTAGGVKVVRFSTMLRHLGNELNRLVHPSTMLRDDVQYDEKPREIAKAVWSAFFLAILTITVATLVFAAQGFELPQALSIATGTFAQTSNVVSEALPGLQAGAVSDDTLLAISAFAVVARIEILVVLAALAGNRW